MRIVKALICVSSMLLLCVGSAFANKQAEMDEFLMKPWSLADLPQINRTLADVFEVEPNDVCPGNDYTLGDTFHGALNPGGDVDWICFSVNLGDLITAGTDADPGLPTVDTFIELWAQDCATMVASNDDGGPGLYSLIDGFKAEYTGNYYLKIRGFSSSSVGNYIAIVSAVPQTGPGFCPVGLYKASKINVNQEIPDNDPAGLCTPAIKFNPNGFEITDVVIDINMNHTWVGDLVITLCHTSSTGEVKCVDLLNRPGVPQSTFGCSGDLTSDPEDKYFFGSDPTLEPLGEFDCPSIIAPACYAVAVENSLNLRDTFWKQPCGDGIWELCLVDNASGDVGTIFNWSVHLLCEQPISVEETTWGQVKSLYRTD